MVESLIFSIFCARKQKSNKFGAKFSKKVFFKFAPKRWSSVLFSVLTELTLIILILKFVLIVQLRLNKGTQTNNASITQQ